MLVLVEMVAIMDTVTSVPPWTAADGQVLRSGLHRSRGLPTLLFQGKGDGMERDATMSVELVAKRVLCARMHLRSMSVSTHVIHLGKWPPHAQSSGCTSGDEGRAACVTKRRVDPCP
jgi:hypothetical protein